MSVRLQHVRCTPPCNGDYPPSPSTLSQSTTFLQQKYETHTRHITIYSMSHHITLHPLKTSHQHPQAACASSSHTSMPSFTFDIFAYDFFILYFFSFYNRNIFFSKAYMFFFFFTQTLVWKCRDDTLRHGKRAQYHFLSHPIHTFIGLYK